MGGSMSITNETNVSLNIALKQMTPLYYQNDVKPGETMYRSTGAVHFTIEANIDYARRHQYSKMRKFVPITLLSLGSLLTLGSLLAVANVGMPVWFIKVLMALGQISVGGGMAYRELSKNASLSSHGWYAGYNHRLAIRGGPKVVEINGCRFISSDVVEPLTIVKI
ncbi:2189_t:CDS:2 [Ambispora gerdemannii]|uniref:2189_t:CDS:1 n=1 Tax=Ambispora gerdemannii TaxID=144530 RepID=A0A9N9BCL6_9GLOM|nr:2189_t:CDS:2 [Ambispora gerdemannii]